MAVDVRLPQLTEATTSRSADAGGDRAGRISATPLAARVAEAGDVALATVPVTGRRITRADVEAHLRARESAERAPVRSDDHADLGGVVNRSASVVTIHAECQVDALDGLLRQIGESRAEVAPTFTDFLVAACTRVLRQFPAVDTSVAGEENRGTGKVDIAVTVATTPGTVVLLGCERKSLLDLSRERQAAREQPRAGEGTSFAATLALTHLDLPGLTRVAPTLGSSRCALGVGSIEPRTVTEDGRQTPGHLVGCTFVAGREAFDEPRAAAWLVALRQLIEDPMRVFLEL